MLRNLAHHGSKLQRLAGDNEHCSRLAAPLLQSRSFADPAKDRRPVETEEASPAGQAGSWLKNAVKATAHEAKKTASEALGTKKPLSHDETQEPAGVMENRQPGEQPHARYQELVGKAKKQWKGTNVSDLYQNANANANVTAESGSHKAKEHRKGNEASERVEPTHGKGAT